MFRAEDYVKVDSLSEAYELCQKRSSLVVGGMVWLKMTSVTKRTIVDLSGLGLDKIEETKEEFRIGAMCTLRQLETDQGLDQYFGGVFKECTRHIVGVQMRNLATVGGSIYSRFGFSDILTCLMALDTYVELYHGGIVPLEEFAKRPVRRDDRDILVRVHVKKNGRKAAYQSFRNTKTDFPVLSVGVSRLDSQWKITVGARPARAVVAENSRKLSEILSQNLTKEASEAAIRQFASAVSEKVRFGSNMRASSEYRRILSEILIYRAVRDVLSQSEEEKM